MGKAYAENDNVFLREIKAKYVSFVHWKVQCRYDVTSPKSICRFSVIAIEVPAASLGWILDKPISVKFQSPWNHQDACGEEQSGKTVSRAVCAEQSR